MTKKEAVKYLKKVLIDWNHWHNHHKKLITAIEVLLEEVDKE